MSERWRCFVAVPIGEALRARLEAESRHWPGMPGLDRLRWADPASWHLTLAFLGMTDADEVPRLAAALREAAGRHAPMRLATGGLGAFPSSARARVAWYGIADPDRALAALAADVASAVGLEEGSRFRPHLTLARARREPVDLRAWLATASVPEGELVVDRVELMRSHLGRGPAQYEAIASVQLGVHIHV